MESLLERALRCATRHPAPALRLRELTRLMSESGPAATEEVVLRAVSSAPESFRVLNPWRGPWRGLQTTGSHAHGRRRRAQGWGGAPAFEYPGDLWIVPPPRGAGPATDHPIIRRLREGVIRMSWHVDADSTRDLARWQSLVQEGIRVHGVLRRHLCNVPLHRD